MTEPIDPEDADDGYYWSTDQQMPCRVLGPPDRTANFTDRFSAKSLSHLDGQLIPLDLPPDEPGNDKREAPLPGEVDNCDQDDHIALFDGPPDPKTGRQLGRCARRGCTVTIIRDGDGGYEIHNDPEANDG